MCYFDIDRHFGSFLFGPEIIMNFNLVVLGIFLFIDVQFVEGVYSASSEWKFKARNCDTLARQIFRDGRVFVLCLGAIYYNI